jgi:hypothetical protein
MLRRLMGSASRHTGENPPVPLRPATGEAQPPEPDSGTATALTLLQKLVEQELGRSERFVTRARQAFALAAGFFAVVQTVAFGSFAKAAISTPERTTLLWIAGGAGVLLAACGAVLLYADTAYKTMNLTPEGILEVLNEEDEDGLTADERYVEDLADIVKALRETNRRRQRAVLVTQVMAFLSIACVLAELLYSLDARLS